MATRDEIYTAIRNADKAGDSAAVRKLGAYLQTMPAEGAAAKPLDASSTHEMAVKAADEPSLASKVIDWAPPIASADSAANLASGAVAAPVAGLAGMGAGAVNTVTDLLGTQRLLPPAADVVGNVQSAMTYQPRTKLGQATTGVIGYPFQKLAEGADWAGKKTAEATGSPALGAAVNTGIQAIPMLIAPEARGAFGSAGRAVTGGGKIAATASANALAAATTKAKAYVTGTAGLDWNALSDSLKAKLTTVAQTAGQLEQLDPAALAREAKLQSLPVPVPATRGQLTRDPVALRNEGNVSTTSAGAPIRDVHLAANQALLDNLDVLKGKVTGTGETAAAATTPEQVGASVQGAARGKLELAKAQVKQLYTAADTSGETLQKVDTQPILDMVAKTPDQSHYGYAKSWLSQNTDGPGLAPSPPAAGSTRLYRGEPSGKVDATDRWFHKDERVADWYSKQSGDGAVTYVDVPNSDLGKYISTDPNHRFYNEDTKPYQLPGDIASKRQPLNSGSGTTIRDLEDLRKAAVAKASNGGEDAHYAGKLIESIDKATDGAGGKLYQAARAARKAQGTEFQEQGAVADLVDNSSRTDRATALENTTKTITSGSLEDVRNIKRTLLTGGDETTRTAGRQAWRDVRAQVIQGIKDDATKSVATNVDGSPNLTAAGLKRAIDRYGTPKLEEIFGPGTTRQINAILDAAKDVKTLPPSREVGSSTLANVLAFLEKGITKVPVVGGTAVDIARGVAQLKNLGAGAREAKAATVTPLNEAVSRAAGKAARADYGRQAKGAIPLVPLSALSQQPR